MNDAALNKPGAYAQIRIREPAGERILGPELSLGGPGADIVVPGVEGIALRIERRDGEWLAIPEPGAAVRYDGRSLRGSRELRRDDVIGIGEAQLSVPEVSRTRLRLDVHHLVGNDTIAPVATVAAVDFDGGDEELEIRAAPARGAAAAAARTATAERIRVRRPKFFWPVAAALVAVALVAVILVSTLHTVMLDVRPEGANITTPGTSMSLHLGSQLLLPEGQHVVRAEMDGYVPAQTNVNVVSGRPMTARLRLAKTPGELNIDTNNVPVRVSVDGADVGRAPGIIPVPQGSHTITLRAPRYLDHVVTMDIEGAGVRQDLTVRLSPAWGTLKVSVVPAGARVSVDGRDVGVAPASAQIESGVRQVRIESLGHKTWESSIVMKAGQTLSIGPITLGRPDASLTVRSKPAGAEVTIGGRYRGRTPLNAELPADIAHDVVLSLPGHANWTQSVFADAGRKIAIDAQLKPITARIIVQGEPADAEVFVDGKSRGVAPQTFELTAVQHSIEVRKEGFEPFQVNVTPEAGIERKVDFKLTSSDKAIALQESAPTITTKGGYTLRLVPRGKFQMGSDRREQGRRPNEGLREITLERPYYIGVNEVTNADYRKFRSAHASGYIEKQTLDLDAQPVAAVTWDDAAEYCNWLSEQEGLPPAYERRDGKFFLIRPVTAGYRLPTEAEWEYAARFVAPGKTQRFAWGDGLPVAPQFGNVAGTESRGLIEGMLEGYTDDYPAAASIGKFKASPLGLHDMAGNVSEWTNDYYLSFVSVGAATDPLGPEPTAQHVVRGANWRSASVGHLRFAYRDSGEDGADTIGFRVARYAQ
jgi:formylglycine-generating enzyme required for sulfatase activity